MHGNAGLLNHYDRSDVRLTKPTKKILEKPGYYEKPRKSKEIRHYPSRALLFQWDGPIFRPSPSTPVALMANCHLLGAKKDLAMVPFPQAVAMEEQQEVFSSDLRSTASTPPKGQ